MEFKINVKIKEKEVYGNVGSMVIYKGGYYTYVESGEKDDNIYRVIGKDENGFILIESIYGGVVPYENEKHHFWKTKWRSSTMNEIQMFKHYENQRKDQAQGSQ